MKLTSFKKYFFVFGLLSCVPFAFALDKLKIGVFPASSSVPFYIASERGYFKDEGLEVEGIPMNTHQIQVQALVAGEIDGCANLVTLEAANINQRRPDTVTFISLNGANSKYLTEQFLVSNVGPYSSIKSLKELKGAKILVAPGPANVFAAKASLKAVGLEDVKDYTMTEQAMGIHVGAILAGSFDAAYTLEPVASMIVKQSAGKRIEGGVIATYILGKADALAYVAGGALAVKLITEKPDVAQRYAKAWARAVKDVATDPKARDYLTKFQVPADMTATIPLAKLTMLSEFKANDYADFQKFINFGVDTGLVKGPIDVKTFVKSY